jgi:hypothetical protein
MLFQIRVAQPLSLPHSEVGILDTQLGKRTWFSASQAVIDFGKFPKEDSCRPTVKYDVMDCEEKCMLITAQS